MRLDEKVTYIRAKLRWFAQDMDQWAGLLSSTDPKFKEFQCSASEILRRFRGRLVKELNRMDDPDACPSNCKWMYFCELEKGHEGNHREGGLGWSDNEFTKTTPRKSRSKEKTKR